VPSKLGLSEMMADQEERAPPPTPALAGQGQRTLSEGIGSFNTVAAGQDQRPLSKGMTSLNTTAADQRTSPPPEVPRPLQPPGFQPPGFQSGIDSQLTANLLQLAEIAANMSDSDDDDGLEMGRRDLPYDERLLRILESQSTTSKWHPVAPSAVEPSAPDCSTTDCSITISQPIAL
jgi:hypothetical protein